MRRTLFLSTVWTRLRTRQCICLPRLGLSTRGRDRNNTSCNSTFNANSIIPTGITSAILCGELLDSTKYDTIQNQTLNNTNKLKYVFTPPPTINLCLTVPKLFIFKKKGSKGSLQEMFQRY